MDFFYKKQKKKKKNYCNKILQQQTNRVNSKERFILNGVYFKCFLLAFQSLVVIPNKQPTTTTHSIPKLAYTIIEKKKNNRENKTKLLFNLKHKQNMFIIFFKNFLSSFFLCELKERNKQTNICNYNCSIFLDIFVDYF